MPIATVNGIVTGLAQKRQPLLVNKGSLANAVAGQFFALWRATGNPGQGVIPGAAAIPDFTTVGALPFAAPTGGDHSYIAGAGLACQNAGADFQLFDRLGHMAGLSGTVTTAQTANLDLTVTTNNLANRRGAADFSDVLWWLEVYTDLGATGVNATVNVTYDDASTGNLAAVALGANPRAGRRYPLTSAVAGRYIRQVNSVTLSATTGTAGNFGVTATRLLTSFGLGGVNETRERDWAGVRLPRVHDQACLELGLTVNATSTGTLFGNLILIQG